MKIETLKQTKNERLANQPNRGHSKENMSRPVSSMASASVITEKQPCDISPRESYRAVNTTVSDFDGSQRSSMFTKTMIS